MEETRFRICPLCEATCGLAITVEGREVVSIRGDEQDVFSAGFVCPKGAALKDLDGDPDRLRVPLVRRDGRLEPATWEEAFAEIERRLLPILARHGKDAVATYLGNPSVHNFALALYQVAFLRVLRSANNFSASTVDQMPKQLAAGLMFGGWATIPVPDIDRTDLLVVLGANPFESNGSVWTVPDFPGRLRALRQRGGRCIVVDPRRTRTARAADEHVFLRPGTDAYFLLGVVHTLFDANLVRLGAAEPFVRGVDEVEDLARPWSPERVAPLCGVESARIRGLAHELAAAERAAVYARIGTCTQKFGTLASWLVDLCNILTGHLDAAGGAMFPRAAAFAANTHGPGGVGRGIRVGRRRSRVRQAPEVAGEFPVACLAEEIETPGEGQIRALITVAGNPVLSTPNGARLAKALSQLDFMLSLDLYLNETTSHADVILPGLSPLENSHYDVALSQFGYRNAARYSPPIFPAPENRPADWQVLLRLLGLVSGQGLGTDLGALDDFVALNQVQSAVGAEGSIVAGRDPAELLRLLSPRVGPERLLDLNLRTGPYGDGFGARPDGLTLEKLLASPHGVDLGALAPRLPEVLRTPSGKIELAPELLVRDMERLRAEESPAAGLVLIGRRHLRSNNSWMHNLPVLVSGRPRCTLLMHPEDARTRGIHDGERAHVSSRDGALEVAVEITAEIMPGVVSLPHGWGHDLPGVQLRVAAAHAGVNSNLLAGACDLDVPSGNAVLNGIPVEVRPAGVA